MHKYRVLLAACALATITLVGCHDPTGVPNNRVHAATLDTVVCVVNYSSNLTGSVSHHVDGQTPGGWYNRSNPYITWGYYWQGMNNHADSCGFAVFDVPEFSMSSGLPACTLYYYVSEYSGSVDLLVNHIQDPQSWPGPNQTLYQAIAASTDTLAKDGSITNTGWHKVGLNEQGCGILGSIGAGGGDGTFFTGWKYMETPQSGSYAEVTGADVSLSPYIVVIYEPAP